MQYSETWLGYHVTKMIPTACNTSIWNANTVIACHVIISKVSAYMWVGVNRRQPAAVIIPIVISSTFLI